MSRKRAANSGSRSGATAQSSQNVTGLPAAGSGEPVIGFDCGPGNVLIDGWAAEHLGQPFDRDGNWAAGGHSNAALLEAMLQEPYLSLPPPKSTGRELFNRQWLSHKLAQRKLDPRDVQATLTRFTAVAIGQAIARHVQKAIDVLVCGGGAFNATHGATMAGHVIAAAVERSRLDPAEVEDVIIGCGFPEGATGQNVARVFARMDHAPDFGLRKTWQSACAAGLCALSRGRKT